MARPIVPPSTARGRRQEDPGVVAERHDGDGVVPAQAVDQLVQGILDRLEPGLALHRPGGIDDEGQGRRVAGAVTHVAGLQADAEHELVRVGERGRAAIDGDRERRRRAAGGSRGRRR